MLVKLLLRNYGTNANQYLHTVNVQVDMAIHYWFVYCFGKRCFCYNGYHVAKNLENLNRILWNDHPKQVKTLNWSRLAMLWFCQSRRILVGSALIFAEALRASRVGNGETTKEAALAAKLFPWNRATRAHQRRRDAQETRNRQIVASLARKAFAIFTRTRVPLREKMSGVERTGVKKGKRQFRAFGKFAPASVLTIRRWVSWGVTIRLFYR